MFFGLTTADFAGLSAPVKIFLSLAHGFHNSVPIVRASQQDKEYHFQNWVERRINAAGLSLRSLVDTVTLTSFFLNTQADTR